GARAARPGRAGGALALARRARRGLVGGARAAGLVVAHGGAVLARRLLPPRAGRVQRVGRLAHRGWGGGAVRRERAVAARARAALVDRRRRGRAGARGAVPRPLPRPRHRAAGGRRGVRVVDVVGDGGRDRRDGTDPRRRGAGPWAGRAATRATAPPRAVSLLERLGTAPPAPPPRTPGELYAWWLASPLAIDDYPASLAVWTRAGEPQGEIRLASVDLPSSLVAALVRSPETARGPRVERLDRSPGVHYILVLPLGGAGADVLTVGVGPRTRLIPAARVARFLQGAPRVQPPYHVTLSPPAPPPAAASARVIWTRTGWSARGERRLELPDGVHHVHLTVDLREPWALLVRGV